MSRLSETILLQDPCFPIKYDNSSAQESELARKMILIGLDLIAKALVTCYSSLSLLVYNNVNDNIVLSPKKLLRVPLLDRCQVTILVLQQGYLKLINPTEDSIDCS